MDTPTPDRGAVTLPDDLLETVDAWRTAAFPGMSRPQAVGWLARVALTLPKVQALRFADPEAFAKTLAKRQPGGDEERIG